MILTVLNMLPRESSRRKTRPTALYRQPLVYLRAAGRLLPYHAAGSGHSMYGSSSGSQSTKSGAGFVSNRTASTLSLPSLKALQTRCIPSITRPSWSRMIGWLRSHSSIKRMCSSNDRQVGESPSCLYQCVSYNSAISASCTRSDGKSRVISMSRRISQASKPRSDCRK